MDRGFKKKKHIVMGNDTEKQKPRGKGIKAKVQAQEKPQQTRAVRETHTGAQARGAWETSLEEISAL